MSEPTPKKKKPRKKPMVRRRSKPSAGEIITAATAAFRAARDLYDVAKPHISRVARKIKARKKKT